MAKDLIPNENLLRSVAARGVMNGREFVLLIPRARGDYTDFYGAAALLQNGFLSTDSTVTTGKRETKGCFGHTAQDTAAHLYQLAIGPDEKFRLNPDMPWWNGFNPSFEVQVFITGEGVLKLEEIALRAEAVKQKRKDYLFAALTGVLVALVSSVAAHHFNPSSTRGVVVPSPTSEAPSHYESNPG